MQLIYSRTFSLQFTSYRHPTFARYVSRLVPSHFQTTLNSCTVLRCLQIILDFLKPLASFFLQLSNTFVTTDFSNVLDLCSSSFKHPSICVLPYIWETKVHTHIKHLYCSFMYFYRDVYMPGLGRQKNLKWIAASMPLGIETINFLLNSSCVFHP